VSERNKVSGIFRLLYYLILPYASGWTEQVKICSPVMGFSINGVELSIIHKKELFKN
jgi:hypothetical protein